MNRYLKIREFSQMTGINAPLLRYYDSIGLLKPSYRGENNYRMYGYEQLDEAWMIETFRVLGVSLSDIKNIMNGRSPDSSIIMLKKQLAATQEHIQKLEALKSRISSIIESAETVASLNVPSISLEHLDTLRCFISKASVNIDNDIPSEASFIMECQKHTLCGFSDIGYLYQKTVLCDRDMRNARMFIMSSSGPDTFEAGNYVISYDTFNNTHNSAAHLKRLQSFIHDKHLEPDGGLLEEPVVNEMLTDNRDEMLIRLSIRVKG